MDPVLNVDYFTSWVRKNFKTSLRKKKIFEHQKKNNGEFRQSEA